MSKKKITLTSTEGASFEIDEAIALQSQKIADVVKDDCTKNDVVPLPNVKSKILALVIEYCKKHVDGVDEEELKEWDTEFMKFNDQSTLYDLIIAAYDLNIKSLIHLTCKTVADMISYKTPDEIREFFKIKNDLTPEEEEQIRSENSWAFE